jgi:hypothetical protein
MLCFDKLSINGKSNDFNTPPFALSLSKGKRLVWATARQGQTPTFVRAKRHFG